MRELHKQWGRNLRHVREMRGLTQDQLADALNVEQQTVSKWETGIAAPRDAMKLRIATELKAEVGLLFPLVAVSA